MRTRGVPGGSHCIGLFRLSRLRTAGFVILLIAVGFIDGLNRSAVASDATPAATSFEQQDYVTAVRLNLPLAQAGDIMAQYRLGMMYRFGWGVNRDFNLAREWLQKSAEQGYGGAAAELGKIFKDGRGVDKDPVAAVKWFKLGAQRGFGVSQLNLGRMVRDGVGTPADPVEAYAWFSLAIDNQYMDAIGHRNRLVDTMSPDQVARAKQLATRLRTAIKSPIAKVQ